MRAEPTGRCPETGSSGNTLLAGTICAMSEQDGVRHLRELAALRAAGALSDTEFQKAKTRLLAGSGAGGGAATPNGPPGPAGGSWWAQAPPSPAFSSAGRMPLRLPWVAAAVAVAGTVVVLLAVTGLVGGSPGAGIEDSAPAVGGTGSPAVLATIPPAAEYIQGIAVSTDGTRVFATTTTSTADGQALLMVVDADTATTVATTPLPLNSTYSTDLVVAPDGSPLVYICGNVAEQQVAVLVVDTSTQAVVQQVVVPDMAACSEVAITPDGLTVLVTGVSSGLAAVDTMTSTAASITSDGYTNDVDVSPDGTRIYVANSGDQTLTVADDTGRTQVVPLAVEPTSVSASPDGRHLFVAGQGSTDLHVLEVGSWSTVATVPLGTEEAVVDVAPDGRHAYVVRDDFSIIDTASFTVVDTVDLGVTGREVEVSPDGTRLYVASAEGVIVVGIR